MRTARLPTVSLGIPYRGVGNHPWTYPSLLVPCLDGHTHSLDRHNHTTDISTPLNGTLYQGYPAHGQTDTCENITFPPLHMLAVIKETLQTIKY